MRIVREDPKLGISKVVWVFPQEPVAPPAPEKEQEVPLMPEPTELPSPEPELPEDPSPEPESRPGQEAPANSEENAIEAGHLADLRQQIRFLQQVVESQNQQLKTKDELIRNFQVLLKTEQEQVLRLESREQEKKGEGPVLPEKTGWFRALARKLVKQ